ncbi:MAG: hypothetical protein-putative related to sulfatases [uncultured Phycisphaerae bacterium]|uniref:Sulfatase n=1 Tax=uncultured Phycisphaerae bacterium TaxID=904963 RepID=A0A6J4P2M7_9BACT|nr:MAG: hypothetical protein-putative related to sulfatases [uncultured Phycisphaerae bacterium]
MRPFQNNLLTRRDALRRATLGFGSLALADLLARASIASAADAVTAGAAGGAGSPAAARAAHFAARAKRVIYVYLDGGLSQVDSYDYKPRLQVDDGKPLPASIAKPKFSFAPTGHVLASPFGWQQYGRSGTWASDLFPEVNKLIDELCFVKSLYHDNEDHFTAKNMIATGSGRETRPPVGSWVSYGLGTANANLPAFVEIMPGVPKGTPAAFLPARHAPAAIGRPDNRSPHRSWDNLLTAEDRSQRRRVDLVRAMNAERLARSGPDAAVEAEVQNMELAFRMQTEAPDLMSLARESEATQAMYGIGGEGTDDFGRACLMARRFAERGVRYVTVMHSTREFGNLWDQHKDLEEGHRNNAAAVDLPIAGLLRDLRQRGMLDDTLVMCGSEFGRTPVFEFQDGAEGRNRNGRDHNPHGFTMWFAGAGVRPGFSYGATDDYGFYAVQDRVSVHDLHATVLHAMGLDHERLTYAHGGRDYRLTDVYGRVVREIFA